MKTMLDFIKQEIVLFIALIAAIVSVFFVPPDAGYSEYIDFHVLILLFSLMAVVAGIQKCGLLNKFAHFICKGEKSIKLIVAALVLLCFFTSMLITNDVSLITFVPFAILTLSMVGKKKYIIFTVVMQTIAANLGSMATPVGNPQNLFIYSKFNSSIGEFFSVVLPIVAVSMVLICISFLFVGKDRVKVSFDDNPEIAEPKKLIAWLVLFMLCLLCVFQVLNHWILLAVTVAVVFCLDKKIFLAVDYALLVTFICFFVFAGNIARIDTVCNFINEQMAQNAKLCTIAVSQIISNVPAAVMLSNFTSNGDALLAYTNIGGLGTIIASLASLISFKFYIKSENAKPLRYLLVFSLFNIVFLAILCLAF